MGNKAFSGKVKPVKGTLQLLVAAGFEKQGPTEEFPEGVLVMSAANAANSAWLGKVVEIIELAMQDKL